MATVKIYELTNNQMKYLQAPKLFSIDDFSSWISTIGANTVSNVQYFKNELETSITLDLSQTYAQPSQKIHYISITNEGESMTYYYYVKNTVWRSKSGVRLDLVMDVLNTFKDGTDYTFKENTRIIREHKDRITVVGREIVITYYITQQIGTINEGDTVIFINDHGDTLFTGVVEDIDQYRTTIKITSNETEESIRAGIDNFIQDDFEINKDGANYYFISIESRDDYGFNYTRFRNIDHITENINPLLQCGDAEGLKIEDNTTLLQTSWYLLYRNVNDPSPDSYTNPVECYLIPEDSGIKVDSGYIANGRLIPSYLEDGFYYFFEVPSGQTYTFSNGVAITRYAGNTSIMITKTGEKMNTTIFAVINGELLVMRAYDDISYINISPLPAHFYVTNTIFYLNASDVNTMTFDNEFNNSLSYKTLDDITQVDRTDAKNIKLIKIPYCPYDFTVSSNVIKTSVSPEWEVVNLVQASGGTITCLKLKDLNTDLHSSITVNSSDRNPLPSLKMSNFRPDLTDLRKDASFESKLFNSEFYQPTYVYDSFSFKIQLEKCDIDSYISSRSLVINFDMTRTINSKFMFTFTSYYLRNANENYAKYMPIARNNEEALYNVPYINYVRTGYNYDIKAKNLSNTSNIIGTILSAGSIGASLLFPSAPLKVAGVVSGVVSLANSVKNTIQTAVSNENTIKQKLLQAENQAASVSGSDDVDLMSVYAENRIKYLVYEPTAVMKDLLFKLFFYAGYNSNRLGIPTHNNRVNFDYLEADAVIEATNKNMTEEIITELINSYKNGVTFIHRTNRILNTWDLEQKFENWEKSLF